MSLLPAGAGVQRRIDALIFDCDGTLVDSEGPGLAVLQQAALQIGVTISSEQLHDQFRGMPMAQCVAFIAGQLASKPENFDADFTAHVRRAMAERFRQGLRTLPGALELVASLRLPYCIATNGPREKAELTLGLTGLLPFFEGRIFCAYEVGAFKPAPGLFLHAAEALGVAPQGCAVIEDSLPGIEAGLAAGMQVFALVTPGSLPVAIASRVREIGALQELAPMLRRSASSAG